MSKKLYLPITIFFTAIISAQAPAIQWQKVLGGTDYDSAQTIRQTSDGGYIVAGFAASNDGDVTGNQGSEDYWVVKLDNNGNMQWQKSFGGSFQDFAYSIQQTSDGGYIVAGYSSSTDGDITEGSGSGNCWIVKLNSNGIIQWQKSLGGSDLEWATSIQQTSDGGYIFAGLSESNDRDVTGNHGGSDAWIVKLNENGSIQWQKSLGGTGNDDATAIQQTLDGGYIVAVTSESNNGDVSGNHGGKDYWVVKLNNNGDIQWQKALGGSGDDWANAIQQTSDGGYIVAGISNSNDGDVTDNNGGDDYWVVKLNSNGMIQWQKSLGGSNNDWANAIQQTYDNGYIVAGHSWSNDGDVSSNQGQNDYWIVKLDDNGAVNWQKSLGGGGDDFLYSMHQTTDGGYIMAGQSDSNNGDVTNNHRIFDMWIVKLYPENLNTNETAIKSIVLVENPVKDLLKIQSKETIISMQLYNAAGQLIKTANSQSIPVNELSKGNYILKIQLENGKTISEKIIKE